jgi:hypothetical protein
MGRKLSSLILLLVMCSGCAPMFRQVEYTASISKCRTKHVTGEDCVVTVKKTLVYGRFRGYMTVTGTDLFIELDKPTDQKK